jgi:hypothetical protein
VPPPAGKLPWPQHAPSFDRARYEAMLRALHLANNFGLYQSGTERETAYLHDGLDVVLPNGTPIHAVEAGYVRHIDAAVENYKTVLVEDADEPGRGWGYTHVDDFRVRVGEYVPQGALLATVRFRGVEHVHLDRLHVPPGGDWTRYLSLTHTQPDTFFVYTDTEAPRFEGPFRYFRNDSDSAFARSAAGVTVSGDVDVVVGLRDVGEYARAGTNPVSDRLAVTRVDYAVVPLGAPPGAAAAARQVAFDLSALEIPRLGSRREYLLNEVLFKFYPVIHPGGQPAWWQTRTSYYVVTNAPPGGRRGRMTADDRALSWRTAERDAGGAARYPDGAYVVTVWARDFRGNEATRGDTVQVRN